ncbi:MAG: hypothetical protein MUP98_12955 [Candidatus Aminicenantes bacterium]|nr:hypothetical protein [Candidatus Aminicenantes bacterium]
MCFFSAVIAKDMSKKRRYLLVLGILMTIFLVLEGIGYFLGGRTNTR